MDHSFIVGALFGAGVCFMILAAWAFYMADKEEKKSPNATKDVASGEKSQSQSTNMQKRVQTALKTDDTSFFRPDRNI